MNKLRGLVMFAALGFGALTGCGGVEDLQAPETASVEQDLKYCGSNADCPVGYGCIDSACRPLADDSFACGKEDPATGTMSNTTYCSSSQICCLNTGTCVNSYDACGVM